jgi:hypothetical protein
VCCKLRLEIKGKFREISEIFVWQREMCTVSTSLSTITWMETSLLPAGYDLVCSVCIQYLAKNISI